MDPGTETGGDARAEGSGVKSAERTVRIIEALAAAEGRLTMHELQERTKYPRSSLHALVRTLRELKWIEADSSGLRLGIGPHALLSGTAYIDRDPVLPYARKVLEDLRSEIGHTVHYARRDDAFVIYLESRESEISVQRVYRVGRKLPTHITALGQVLLAELTREEADAILPATLTAATEHSITDRAALHAELAEIRSRGWSYEREQGTIGIACVAAAVDYRIPATDAISCSMPADTAANNVDRVADAVTSHAHRLGEILRRQGIR